MNLELIAPEICRYNLTESWTLSIYDHYVELFIEEEKIIESVQRELTFWTQFDESFRTQVLIQGVSVLLSTNVSKKELRIGTPKLCNEIFLLDQVQNLRVNGQELDKFSIFKDHVKEMSLMKDVDYPGISSIVKEQYDLDSIDEFEANEIKTLQDGITSTLVSKLNSYQPNLFEKVSDFALSLTARYALLRVHLLKFIAILPSLDHDETGLEVKRIFLEMCKRLTADSKRADSLGLKGESGALPPFLVITFYFLYYISSVLPAALLARVIRFKVRFMAKRFIAGETIQSAQHNFKQIFSTGRDVTLDQLGELVVSEKEADLYRDEVLNLIRGFSIHLPVGERNKSGILRAHVSIKVSALCSDFKPEAFTYTYNLVAPRLIEILKEAKKEKVFINIDAEHYHYRDIVFQIYRKVLLETPELSDFQQTGIVLQAYLRDGSKHLKDIVELARERGLIMPIRLVKGAYWDAETVEAEAHGHDAPEFLNKEETDIHFRQMILEIYKSHPHVQICLASHNFSDHSFAVALREKRFAHIPVIEHQCLHMTYEALSTAMAKMGWVVRNYVPIGSLLVGMAYLVRRIMENSSQVGVLTIMRSHKKAKMMTPLEIHHEKKKNGELSLDKTITQLDGEFFNVAPLRTYLDKERITVEEAIHNFSKKSLGQIYENDFSLNGETIDITSPSDNTTLVGRIRFATLENANDAISKIDEEFYREESTSWARLNWIERSSIMTKASALMHIRRNDLTALIMYESGKSLSEALADVDEAIDFINFYIRQQREIEDFGQYTARGPSAVIAPWNFPLAIPCGMVVSSLISGNTVILKSAEQTPLIAHVLVKLLHEAGVPSSALIHLPGEGEVIGQALLESNLISSYIFTGSKPVGVHIAKTTGTRIYKNRRLNISYPVKVITEMGGKNAIIVTNNAELDETVSGILYSSFAHAGQKCSACSRILVDNKIKDKLILRLKEAAADLKVGAATDFSAFINPLISKEEKQRLQDQVREAVTEANTYGGSVIINRSLEEFNGNAVGPTIIELPKSRSKLKESFSQRELFAPVVHVIGFDDLDDALEIFNSVEYGLTGGIFSQSQDDIDYCLDKMSVGNIYVNRSITGARVGVEPFGGFKMSGTGPKAGGVNYIKSLQICPSKFAEDIKSTVEEGSDYSIRLARQSGIPLESRLDRVIRSLDSIINNFGPLFPGIFGKDKKRLQELKKWLLNDYLKLVENGKDNVYTPGQLNFSRFSMSKESCLFLAINERPHIESFINFLMAISCGVGVTVLCTNQKAYVWWKYLIDILVKNRFSKMNVNCYYVGFKHIEELDKKKMDVIIIDADNTNTNELLSQVSKDNGQDKMIKIITNYERVVDHDFESIMQYFTYERSFAINTMRHGAPLEVNLQ